MSNPTDDERVRALIAKHSGRELEACATLLSFAFEELSAWSGRPIKRGADRIVLAEAARGTKTFGAVIRLCEVGFGEQALMLDRSLFEGMAVAHWIAAHRREAAKLFTRHAKFNALLTYETLHGLGWLTKEDRHLRPSVGPKRRKELVDLFGMHGTRPWVGRNVVTVLKEIQGQWDEQGRADLWNFHDVVYRLGNQILHSTATSASVAFTRRTPTKLAVTASPSNQLVSQALYAAYWTYGQLFTLIVDVFKLTSAEAFRDLWQTGGQAFSPAAAITPTP
jgi:Family of unknown function (DUF5677)